MRELEICRRATNKFTVVLRMDDYDAFPYDGLFPTIYQYYRIDSEEELIKELNKELEILAEAIETIYFGTLDVTEKYLEYDDDIGYKLLPCYISESELR